MNLLHIILFVVCIVIIIIVLPIQLRRQRELKRQATLNEHLKMLSEGIDRIAGQNTGSIGNLEENTKSESIRDVWGFPPDKDTVLEEISVADEGYFDWDYIIHIHEGAEQYLGTFHFQSLEKRFSKIHGIDACKQEDREFFLVRTERLSVESLRKAIWDVFLTTAKISHNG